jgi:tRNA(fMet)-specific endonuclease VapC
VKYLLDTDTCSALIKGGPEVLGRRLAAVSQADVRMSVITFGELHYGCALRPRRKALLERVLAFARVVEPLPLHDGIAQHYGEIRAGLKSAGTPIGPNDLWIAAHARALDMTLVTHNLREFKRVPKLKLDDWIGA